MGGGAERRAARFPHIGYRSCGSVPAVSELGHHVMARHRRPELVVTRGEVHGRRRQVGVAEEPLHGVGLGAHGQHVVSAGVAQLVSRGGHAGPVGDSGHDLADAARRKPFGVLGREEGPGSSTVGPHRQHPLDLARYRQHSIRTALAVDE